MMPLPDFEKAWDYENAFYLTCDTSRIGKLLAHYELWASVAGLPGAIVESGVFKGSSLTRFAMFRELLSNSGSKEIIAFDTFGPFPDAEHEADSEVREGFVAAAGEQSITVADLTELLERKGLNRGVELIAGDITKTVPEFARSRPELRISLLNLDTDLYEPATTILEHLYERVVPGGVIMLDDYGTFPGDTQAVEEFFAGHSVRIEKLPFAATPSYIRKPGF